MKLRGIGRHVSSRTLGAMLAASAPTAACMTDSHYQVVDHAEASAPGSSNAGGASGSGGSGGAPRSGGKAGSGGATGGTSGTSGASGSGGGSGTGGAPSSGGTDGGTPDAGDAEAGPHCDETKSPDVESCLVSDDHVVFVAPGPTGADSGVGAGTMASPAHTIGAGIALAGATGKSIVVVCNGTYTDELSIPKNTPAVGIYGGFDCPGGPATAWAYNGSAHATVKPSVPEPALDIESVTSAVVIADIAFTAMDAPAPLPGAAAGSSIGAIVNASSNVTLERVTITAGNGADGAKGKDGVDGADGTAARDAPIGVAASCDSGAPASQPGGVWNGASSCGSFGGTGATASKTAGATGTVGTPTPQTAVPPDDGQGGPGQSTVGSDASNGDTGATGSDSPAGLKGPSLGVFSASGFTVADGQPGSDGNPGQGGGGGGSTAGNGTCVGASGGAGGMGGCGGGHGEAGKGGGASLALLLWDSGATFDTVALVTAKGGKGGVGGDSGPIGHGQSGGAGGKSFDGPPRIGRAGDGGQGGDGGNGGPGSGGTGGPSIALVFHGTEPPGSTPTTTLGAAGPKGTGGSVGVNKAADGTDGLRQPTYEQK